VKGTTLTEWAVNPFKHQHACELNRHPSKKCLVLSQAQDLIALLEYMERELSIFVKQHGVHKVFYLTLPREF
jgi:hypothetical protein